MSRFFPGCLSCRQNTSNSIRSILEARSGSDSLSAAAFDVLSCFYGRHISQISNINDVFYVPLVVREAAAFLYYAWFR